jgi:MFS family permease
VISSDEQTTAGRRFTDGITMFIVTGLSLFLLVYVGMGEGSRTYQQLEIEKLTSQGSRLQATIENHLRAGLPLDQFAGFSSLASSAVNVIDEVDAIAVYNQSGDSLFTAVDRRNPQLPPPSPAIKHVKQTIEIDYSETHTQVILPLRDRFETVGSLVVVASRDGLSKRLSSAFQSLPYIVFGLSALFAIVVWIISPYLARTSVPWLQIGYACTFLATAGGVVFALGSLYSEAVQGKLQASAMVLSQRLNAVIEANVRFRDVDGIDHVFSEYRRLNPEVKEAALIVNDAIQVSSDPKKVGASWTSDYRNFEYSIDLTPEDKSRKVSFVVTAPRSVVYNQVERSVRNFAALFVASAFLAGLFLQVANSMQRLRLAKADAVSSGEASLADEAGLIIVKPIFFLAVFLEHLLYSFLPKFMQDAATASGVSLGYAALPFTAFYLCFALALIPAGRFAEKHGPRALIWGGLIIASTSVFGLNLPLGIVEISVLRGIAGLGQGMLFIGIQAYILAVASPQKKTQGADIIVFGFQGGMISGMAIGSLLVNYMQPHGLFMFSAAIGLVAAAYSAILIPRLAKGAAHQGSRGAADFGIVNGLKHVLRNGEFLKTIFCIGIPAKAILTGTITFALPLLLGQQGYRPEDIGQVIMLYAISVVLASGLVSRFVDRSGDTVTILFWGALISGAGLALIGSIGSPDIGNGLLGAMAVVVGVVCVGLAHGFINAPVVTHVAHSEIAKQIGANSVATTYRFVERLGHVFGPLMVAQLFLIWGQTPQILIGLGIATATLAFLFLVRTSRPRTEAVGSPAA